MNKTICFDLRALQIGHENRGIGMVVKSILENLEDNDNSYIFYIFNKNNPIKSLDIDIKTKKYKIVAIGNLPTSIRSHKDIIGVFRLTFHKFKELRKHNVDVFVQFDFNLGIPRWRNIKTICYGYDLIPLIMKAKYLPTPLFAFNQAIGRKSKLKAFLRSSYYSLRAYTSYSVYKKVDVIISISDYTKQTFISTIGIDEQKINTIHLAPVGKISDHDDSVLKNITKPFIFYIGGTDSRKNVEEVVHAFNIAKGRGSDIQLVLAGNELRSTNKIPNELIRNAISNSPYKEDIILKGFISNEQKNSLYKNALSFISCSSFEGFGLPVLEAQSMSCPVITYNNSSIKEVSGESVKLVKNRDVTGIARSIYDMASENREELSVEGVKFSRKFNWKDHTVKLLDIISKL